MAAVASEQSDADRVPVTVLTGFWRNHAAQPYSQGAARERIAVIDEFGEVIDDERFARTRGESRAKKKSSRTTAASAARCAVILSVVYRAARQAQADGIIIETTGLADPAHRLLHDESDCLPLTQSSRCRCPLLASSQSARPAEVEAIEQVAFADKILRNKAIW